MIDMKQGWEIKKIGDVCKVIAGQSPEGKYYNSDGNGLAFYQGKKEYGEKYIGEPTTWTTVITKEAEANDILMSVRAPVGPINFATQKICIGRGLAAIRASKLIDKEFLFNFLLKHESEIVGNSGAVFNSINKAQIEAIKIPLPPLPEQQRIVAILDEAFAAIAKAKANAQQNLQNAKELFESYLQGVFENKGKMSELGLGRLKDERIIDDNKKEILQSSNHKNHNSDKGEGWEEKRLDEITDVKDGTHDSPKYIKEGIPFVTQKNIKLNGLTLEDTKYITETDHEKFYKRSNVTFGDILISMIGANRGMAALVDDKRIFSIKNVGLIKSSDNINKHFLLYYLKSPLAIKYVLYMSNGGAQEFVGLTALRSFPIPYPPLKTQQTIVQKLDALNAETKKLENIYQQKINDLEELKKSILQKAFSGELKTVRAEV
jgi:type I restriction enzyme S subunit